MSNARARRQGQKTVSGADPTQSFDAFANDEWRATHPIPAEFGEWSVVKAVTEQNRRLVVNVLQRQEQTRPKLKIADVLFASGVDMQARQQAGTRHIRDLMHVPVDSAEAFVSSLWTLHAHNIPVLFSWDVQPDQVKPQKQAVYVESKPTRTEATEYLTESRYGAFRRAYERLVRALSQNPNEVLRVERALVKIYNRTRDQHRRFHHIAEVDPLLRNYWHGPVPFAFFVDNPDFIRQSLKYLMQSPVETRRAYVEFVVMHFYAPALNARFVRANQEYLREMQGATTVRPWPNSVARYIETFMPDVLGVMYANTRKDEKARVWRDVSKWVEQIRAFVVQRVGCWRIDKRTKQLLVTKIRKAKINFWAPSYQQIRRYPSVAPGTPFSAAVRLLGVNEKRRQLAMIPKRPSKIEAWSFVSSLEVDAVYALRLNNITLSAGLFSAPFYEPGQDFYNYAGVVRVIAHEFAHIVDPSSVKYDQFGRWRREPLSKEDSKRYQGLVQCVKTVYSKFEDPQLAEENVDENFADVCAIYTASELVRQHLRFRGAFPWDEFFRRFAYTRAQALRPRFVEKEDVENPHSRYRVRINAALSILRRFHETYNVKPGDTMFQGEFSGLTLLADPYVQDCGRQPTQGAKWCKQFYRGGA